MEKSGVEHMVSKNRLCESPASGRGETIPQKISREVASWLTLLAMTERRFNMKNRIIMLAVLVSCLVLLVRVGFAENDKESPLSKVSPIDEKLKAPGKNAQLKPTDKVPSEDSDKKEPSASGIMPVVPQVTPVQPAPVIQPILVPQPEVQPNSASGERGTQIKWQVLSCGGTFGNSPSYQMANSVSQTAVGCGSSSFYQLCQGFLSSPYRAGFLRGDVNGSGTIELGDVVYLITYLYKNGPTPIPLLAGDVNCNDTVELGDVVYLISYLYKGGPPPPC